MNAITSIFRQFRIPKCLTPDLVTLHKCRRSQQPAIDGLVKWIGQRSGKAPFHKSTVGNAGGGFAHRDFAEDRSPVQP